MPPVLQDEVSLPKKRRSTIISDIFQNEVMKKVFAPMPQESAAMAVVFRAVVFRT